MLNANPPNDQLGPGVHDSFPRAIISSLYVFIVKKEESQQKGQNLLDHPRLILDERFWISTRPWFQIANLLCIFFPFRRVCVYVKDEVVEKGQRVKWLKYPK